MTVRSQLKRVEESISQANAQIVPVSRTANPVPARSYPSPAHTYQEDAQFPNPFDRTSVTTRPMWKIDTTAIQQTKVITTALPPVSTASGVANNPATSGTSLIAVPDLTIRVNATGAQVQLKWSVSASLSSNANTASFALFRDGVQIGPTLYGQSVANNQKFTVSHTFDDKPPLGFHAYSVYWSTSAGTLTGDTKNRYISALILRPQ